MSNQQHKPISLLIIDDHPVVRIGLTSMFSTQQHLNVVGAAANGEEAIAMIKELRPDVLLVDLRMPGMNGVDLLIAIKRRELSTRAIILTSFETDEDIYRAVQAGAQGYVLKDTSLKEMMVAISTVHSGKRYIPYEIADRLAERMMRTELTSRELEILKLLIKGPTNKQIAQTLGISENTARNHVNSIIEKLGASDRTEAVTSAIQRGLVAVSLRQ